jgi:hypothetical protein
MESAGEAIAGTPGTPLGTAQAAGMITGGSKADPLSSKADSSVGNSSMARIIGPKQQGRDASPALGA